MRPLKIAALHLLSIIHCPAAAQELEAAREMIVRDMRTLRLVDPKCFASFPDADVRDLCTAIYDRDYIRCKSLVSNGVDVNSVGDGGLSPLMIAYLCYDDRIFSFLLESDANPNIPVTREFVFIPLTENYRTVTVLASTSPMPGCFELVMQHGGNAATPFGPRKPLLSGLIASRSFQLAERIKLLLAHGVDIDQVDRDGLSAVYVAVAKAQQFEIAELLIQHGADYKTPGPNKYWRLVHYTLDAASTGDALTPDQEASRQQLLRKLDDLGESVEYAEYELFMSKSSPNTSQRPPPPFWMHAFGYTVPERFLDLPVPESVAKKYRDESGLSSRNVGREPTAKLNSEQTREN